MNQSHEEKKDSLNFEHSSHLDTLDEKQKIEDGEVLSLREFRQGSQRKQEVTNQDTGVDIGTFLKRERVAKQLTLKVISNRTKISITLLEHLEENRFSELPSKAYVRGFVRSYAQVLGLDLDICQKILDYTYSRPAAPTPAKKITAFDTPKEKEQINWGRMILLSIAPIICLFLIFYGIQNSKRLNENLPPTPIIPMTINEKTPLRGHENIVEKAAVEDKAAVTLAQTTGLVVTKDTKKIPDAKIVENAKTEATKVAPKEDIKEEVNKAEKPVAQETPKATEKVATKEAVKEVTKEPVKEVAKETVKETIKETPKIEFKELDPQLYRVVEGKELEKQDMKTLLPDNIRYAIIPGLQNVFVNAHSGDSWITYKKDGEPIKKFVLKQGKTILIRGKEIRMFLGNTGAAKVFLNNQLLDLQASKGVKSLVFPAENRSKYKVPLFIYKESGEVVTSDTL